MTTPTTWQEKLSEIWERAGNRKESVYLAVVESFIASLLSTEKQKWVEEIEKMKKEIKLVPSIGNDHEFRLNLVRSGYNTAIANILSLLTTKDKEI